MSGLVCAATLLLAATAAGERALPSLGAGYRVLDVDGGRVLAALPGPAPEGSDPPPRLSIRLFEDGSPRRWPLEGPVSDARLLPGGHALVVTPRGELLELDLATGATVPLDRDVIGPVGTSPDGRFVVYARGEMPDFEVWRLDRKGGAPRPVARGLSPAWSPAISPDGRTVIFASSASGVAAPLAVDGAGAPRQLTSRDVKLVPGLPPELAPFPEGPGPTLLAGGLVVFARGGAVYVMTDQGALRRTVPDAAAPHWIVPGRTLGVVRGDRIVPIELAGGGP